MRSLLASTCLALLVLADGASAKGEAALFAGAAKEDVTPETPIRLCGYASRGTEATEVAQPLFARALAFGESTESAVVVVCIDAILVPAAIGDEIARRVEKETKIPRERIALCATHDHCAPCLDVGLGNLFIPPPPADQVERIVKYTEKFVANAALAAAKAVASMRPASLAFVTGQCGFAANRRAPGGPTDTSVPLLIARDEKGQLIATLAAYACHCTTLGGDFNQTCGEWAGYASEKVERAHPDCVALIAIGCGADANPAPRGKLDDAKTHGVVLGVEIERLIFAENAAFGVGSDAVGLASYEPIAIDAAPVARLEEIELPFGTPRSREDWEKRKAQGGHIGRHAEHFLGLQDAGKPVPDSLPYAIQTIRCGDQVAMVFLAGEVVVDYALRLKRELRAERLFLAAYSNDCPCYIPSRRILEEGGYEAEGAMTYYMQPTRLAPTCEDLIVRAVRGQLPESFIAQASLDEFPLPPSPQRAKDALVVKDGLRVELAACEPLIESPVAIDFAPDGALFVVEMRDYPSGMRGNLEPGGRVKRLTDEDGDGVYDRATIYLDDLPFPTGCLTYGRGLIVCAAPDILFASDEDGDGEAEVRRVLYTGFSIENEQARINSPVFGLDGWVHCAGGLIGGVVEPALMGDPVDLRGRNFRFQVRRHAIEPESGLSQQGLAHDDFGDRFGCDSNTLAFHFPLDEREVAMNPWVAPPPANLAIAHDDHGDSRRLYPLSTPLERFNDPDHASRVTSACGIEIYRDDWLGPEYRDNVFICEPVHNVVTRRLRELDGFTWKAVRAKDESDREFLASRDHWFRPVQAKAGPDGSLYVVDMARFLIEHPRWVSAERLARIDVRAGEDLGRIWRVVRDRPAEGNRRAVPNLTVLGDKALASALDSESGALRDLVARELVERAEFRGLPALEEVAESGAVPAARAQAFALSGLLGSRSRKSVHRAIFDTEPVVRATAISGAARWLSRIDKKTRTIVEHCMEVDSHPRVVRALARAVPHWKRGVDGLKREAGTRILSLASADAYGRVALLALAAKQPFTPVMDAWASRPPERRADYVALIDGLVDTARGMNDARQLELLLDRSLLPHATADDAALLRAVARAVVALDELGTDVLDAPETLSDAPSDGVDRRERLQELFGGLRARVASPETPAGIRVAACVLLGREAAQMSEDLAVLGSLLGAGVDPTVEDAALDRLGRMKGDGPSGVLVAALDRLGPERSETALDALLARAEGCRVLLDAVVMKRLEPSRIDAARRERLLTQSDAAIATRAAEILGRPAGAKATLAALAPVVAMNGDRARGAAQFDRLCASCHAFRGKGSEIGADLAGLTDRTTSGLLAAIADPNAAVDARYQAYEIATKDGRTLLGIVESESTTAVAMKMQNGIHESVLRTDVRSIRATGRSLMPEGLVSSLAHQDVADLIAWLQTAPRALDSVTAEDAEQARRRLEVDGLNGCATILAGSLHPAQASWIGVLPMRYCRQTDGNSRVAWRTAPVTETLLDGAKARFRIAAAMGWRSMPASGFTLSVNGREALHFDVAIDDATFTRPDGEVTVTWYVHARNGEDATGVLTLDVASAWLKKGEGTLMEVKGDAAGSQRWFGVLDVTVR